MPSRQQLEQLPVLAGAAIAAACRLKMPAQFARLALAQAILESDWGLAEIACNNVFRIRANGSKGEGWSLVHAGEGGSAWDPSAVSLYRNYYGNGAIVECFADHAMIFHSGTLQPNYRAWLKLGPAAVAERLAEMISWPSSNPLYSADHNYPAKVKVILRDPSIQHAWRAWVDK